MKLNIIFSTESEIKSREIHSIRVDYDEVVIAMENGDTRRYPRQCSECGHFEKVKQ